MTYHVGDHVRVKDWDELVAISDDADKRDVDDVGFHIEEILFNPKMRQYCGHEYVVSGGIGGSLVSLADVETGKNLYMYDRTTWAFNEEMLTPVDAVPPAPIMPTLSFEELFTK